GQGDYAGGGCVALGDARGQTTDRGRRCEIGGDAQGERRAARGTRSVVRIQHRAGDRLAGILARRKIEFRRNVRDGRTGDGRGRSVVGEVGIRGRARDRGCQDGSARGGLRVAHADRPQARAGGQRGGHAGQGDYAGGGCVALGDARGQTTDRG